MTALNQFPFLVFRIDHRQLAMPLEVVEQVCPAVEITPLSQAPETVLGLINVHGSIIVALNLRKKLNLVEREIELTDQLVIANLEDRQFALLVDEVEGVVQGFPENISATESVVKVKKGEENQSIVVHQLANFLSSDEEEMLRLALQVLFTES